MIEDGISETDQGYDLDLGFDDGSIDEPDVIGDPDPEINDPDLDDPDADPDLPDWNDPEINDPDLDDPDADPDLDDPDLNDPEVTDPEINDPDLDDPDMDPDIEPDPDIPDLDDPDETDVCIPEDEICNGLDDDCDDIVDNDPIDVGGDCDTGYDGICAVGTWECTDDPVTPRICAVDIIPGEFVEMCNNEDDDCDGVVDNDPADVGGDCDTGYDGICALGVYECTANPVTPRVCSVITSPGDEVETCNYADDDCNGLVDDSPTDVGGACDTGLDGICSTGTYTCVDDPVTPRVCDPDVDPGTVVETCNYADDDCNGLVDDSPTDVGGACSTGYFGICATGTYECIDDPVEPLVCTPDYVPGEVEEFCNYEDDDCDDIVDNDTIDSGGECATGLPGICSIGTFVCIDDPVEPLVCSPDFAPDEVTEVCDDTLDNDCDTIVDEADDWYWDGAIECFEPCADDSIRTCLSTGLDVRRYLSSPEDWSEANSRCTSMGWRQPTIAELEEMSFLGHLTREDAVADPDRETFLSSVYGTYWNRPFWSSELAMPDHYRYHRFLDAVTDVEVGTSGGYYTMCVRETPVE